MGFFRRRVGPRRSTAAGTALRVDGPLGARARDDEGSPATSNPSPATEVHRVPVRRLVAVAAVGISAVAAGCGGGDDSSTDVQAASTAPSDSRSPSATGVGTQPTAIEVGTTAPVAVAPTTITPAPAPETGAQLPGQPTLTMTLALDDGTVVDISFGPFAASESAASGEFRFTCDTDDDKLVMPIVVSFENSGANPSYDVVYLGVDTYELEADGILLEWVAPDGTCVPVTGPMGQAQVMSWTSGNGENLAVGQTQSWQGYLALSTATGELPSAATASSLTGTASLRAGASNLTIVAASPGVRQDPDTHPRDDTKVLLDLYSSLPATGAPASPDQPLPDVSSDYQIDITDCVAGFGATFHAVGTVTNLSGTVQSYEFDIRHRLADGSLFSGGVRVESVWPGATAEWGGPGLASDYTTECFVSDDSVRVEGDEASTPGTGQVGEDEDEEFPFDTISPGAVGPHAEVQAREATARVLACGNAVGPSQVNVVGELINNMDKTSAFVVSLDVPLDTGVLQSIEVEIPAAMPQATTQWTSAALPVGIDCDSLRLLSIRVD